MQTYRIAILDTHPAALSLDNKIQRSPLGAQGINYFPHLSRSDAERHANRLNRARTDNLMHAYVETAGPVIRSKRTPS